MESNQNNIQFIIHRGSHQIGGNCVELATQNTRILIDCGLPLDFEEQPKNTQEKILEDSKEWTRNCDAIFLSHYHADHYGLLNEAPEGTKVYATKETAELMKISGIFGEDLTKHLDIQPIENTVIVKDFRVTKYDVDHSAFGASAFLFEVYGKTILYSGDIRLHGKKGILYQNLPQHVDYLFLEGTNLGRGGRQKTEDEVRDEFVERFSENNDCLHLVWCSSQNIDRIIALYRACKSTGRTLCVDPYTAYVLELAQSFHTTIPTAKTHSNLLIFYPHYLTSKMKAKDENLIYGPFVKRKKLNTSLLKTHPNKYVLLFRPTLLYYAKTYLNDVKVCLTNSIWKEYWNQDREDINRLKAWIDEEPELRKRLPDIHTSGHADVESLQQIVEHIKPKTIIPIHTEYSESFSSLFPKANVMEVTDEMRSNMP